jgi:ferredoxin
LIVIESDDIRGVPHFVGDNFDCKGCAKCVAGCPGLAITLVNSRKDAENPIVSIPYEFTRESLEGKQTAKVIDTNGEELGEIPIVGINAIPNNDRTVIVRVKAPRSIATRIAGIRIQPPEVTRPLDQSADHMKNETIVCRCEHVTAGEIRALIRQGYRDINEIKAISRAGMGACGSKTCGNLILRLFREEGVPLDQVTENTRRPLFVEVPLGAFAGISTEEEGKHA